MRLVRSQQLYIRRTDLCDVIRDAQDKGRTYLRVSRAAANPDDLIWLHRKGYDIGDRLLSYYTITWTPGSLMYSGEEVDNA